MLARLGIAHDRARDTGDAAATEACRQALMRVLQNTDRLSFEQTLRACAADGGLGLVVECCGLKAMEALGVQRGLNVNDLLAESDTVRERGLTTSEAAAVRETFGGTLDPTTVRLRFTTGAQTMGAAAMVLGNTVQVDPTSRRWGFRPGTTLPMDPENPDYNEVLLGHEMTHVWSYQHQGTQYAIRSVQEQLQAMSGGNSRGGAYDYEPGLPSFWSYGEEQRAMIVEDWTTGRRARARGESTFYANGVNRTVDTDEHLDALAPYIQQMQSAGPGQPHPVGVPEAVPCARPHGPFRQDGVAGALGEQADALLAAAGQAAVTSLRADDPVARVTGALGVAGVVAASLAPREQNVREGGRGGGSALLDQANVPRGVTIRSKSAEATARLGYDAGLQNARIEIEGHGHAEVGSAHVRADADAAVGLGGDLQRVHGSVQVSRGDTQVHVSGSLNRRGPVDQVRAQASAMTPSLSGRVDGSAELAHGEVRSAFGRVQVDAPFASAVGQAQFGRGGAFQAAELDVGVGTGGGHVGAGVRVVQNELDAIDASVSAPIASGKGIVSARVGAAHLTTQPEVSATAAVSVPAGTVTVTASKNLGTGETQGHVGLTVPLK